MTRLEPFEADIPEPEPSENITEFRRGGTHGRRRMLETVEEELEP